MSPMRPCAVTRRGDGGRRSPSRPAKQSGRAVVPVIESPIAFDRHLSDTGDGLRVILVEPPAGPACDRLDRLTSGPRPQHAMLTIGPEGGWSEDELSRARAEGWENANPGLAHPQGGRRACRLGRGPAVYLGGAVGPPVGESRNRGPECDCPILTPLHAVSRSNPRQVQDRRSTRKWRFWCCLLGPRHLD